MYGPGRLTSELSEPGHIPLRHNLSVLESRTQGSDVRVLERILKRVQNDCVRPISDGVNVLNQKKSKLTYKKRGSKATGLTTCHPSRRKLGMISFRTSVGRRMNPRVSGLSEYGSYSCRRGRNKRVENISEANRAMTYSCPSRS